MRKEVEFAEDCIFECTDEPEVVNELLTDWFIEFANKLYGKQVLERKL